MDSVSFAPSPFASMLAGALLLALLVGAFLVGREWGERDTATLCRRTLQHRLTVTREQAEGLMSEEAKLWGDQ